jgi:hypothetical protein
MNLLRSGKENGPYSQRALNSYLKWNDKPKKPGNLYSLQKAWYFDRIYWIDRMLTLQYILSILLILSDNF